jgi:outer membrane protein assembly factor BamB
LQGSRVNLAGTTTTRADRATWAKAWHFHVPGISDDDDVSAADLYSSRRVYIGGKDGILYSLNAANGANVRLYNIRTSGDYGVFSCAALYDSLVCSGGGDRRLPALNAAIRQQTWFSTMISFVAGSPAVTDGVLSVGSIDGTLSVLHPTNHAGYWEYDFRPQYTAIGLS